MSLSNDRLSDSDIQELADALAIQLHRRLGSRVYRLHRTDVAELIAPHIDDLIPEDQNAVAWMVWHLFQDALDIETQTKR